MKDFILNLLLSVLFVPLFGQGIDLSKSKKLDGFFAIHYLDGKVMMEVDHLDEDFLYVPFLAEGLGSNDIGLDRGQTGRERVVRFIKEGGKILLIEPNLSYRAISDDPLERKSVEQAFAKSVLFGFDPQKSKDGKTLIDLTPFLIRDEHGVANRLKRTKQGSFSLDKSRSVISESSLHVFPKNVEMEAILTFSGDGNGDWLESVAPNSDHVTIVQHHSFVQLPDDEYEPRVYDARSGYYPMTYADYAAPIEEDMIQRFIVRHRLQKKDPSAAVSEAVEPIIYYVDSGCPEPIRSALIEGASWWNQAFEAAGYKDAFQVKVLPKDASPLDVRYNVIQWVHRSTRGWSYGASVVDPRTGEIIKGHVSLGSLRVRQDYLIAQGLVADYSQSSDSDPMLEMALARLRQLSAHEVGHTLGLMHNFSASTYDRASVMDYPHPLYSLQSDGSVDLSDAYAVGIGEWDKRTIRYGYQDFSSDQTEATELTTILDENTREGFYYLSDADARPSYGVSARAHLWDNAADISQELLKMNTVRNKILEDFGAKKVKPGVSMAKLEDVYTPLYLSTRYQAEATTKLLGGIYYQFSVNDLSNDPKWSWVSPADQKKALSSLAEILSPENLTIDPKIWHLLPPRAPGYANDRENFDSQIKPMFDPLYAAKTYVQPILELLMNPHRLNRLQIQQSELSGSLNISEYIQTIRRGLGSASGVKLTDQIALQSHSLLLESILRSLESGILYPQTRLELVFALAKMAETQSYGSQIALYLKKEIERYEDDPEEYHIPEISKVPDGSPIGCGEQ